MDVLKDLFRQLPGRSGIEDHTRSCRTGEPDGGLDSLERHLELEENDAGVRDELAGMRDVADSESTIGAWRGEDLLLAAGVHHDQGDSGRSGGIPGYLPGT